MITYGSETWCFKIGLRNRPKSCSTSCGKAILGGSLKYQFRNEDIHRTTTEINN